MQRLEWLNAVFLALASTPFLIALTVQYFLFCHLERTVQGEEEKVGGLCTIFFFFENYKIFMVGLVPMVLGIFDGSSNNCRTGLLGLGILFRLVLKV